MHILLICGLVEYFILIKTITKYVNLISGYINYVFRWLKSGWFLFLNKNYRWLIFGLQPLNLSIIVSVLICFKSTFANRLFKVNKHIKFWYFVALWCHNEIHQPATSLAWCAYTQANAQCSHVDGLATSIFSWIASKFCMCKNIFIQWYSEFLSHSIPEHL